VSFTYAAIFEIVDEERTRSALIAEASGVLDAMARRDGARIVGQVTWSVAGNRLIAEGPAMPVDPTPGTDADLARMVELKWSDVQIGKVLGVDRSTVSRRRAALGLPAVYAPFGALKESA
jgi:hypothetical protein